jgi:hypothetical protein
MLAERTPLATTSTQARGLPRHDLAACSRLMVMEGPSSWTPALGSVYAFRSPVSGQYVKMKDGREKATSSTSSQFDAL